MRPDRKEQAPGAQARRMFAYLDGEMSARARAEFEATLAADRILAAEVESHRTLLAALDELAPHSPSRDFRVRLLASLNVRQSWWARLRNRLWNPAPPVANVFTELLDRELAPRQARALKAFVEHDPDAAASLESWRHLFQALDSLPGLKPSEGFADRVMARVRALQLQQASHPAVARSRAGLPELPLGNRQWALARGWIDRRWPSPRDRFAVTSGVAVGPVAAFLVTLHMLSGNPLLTTSNVASFLETRAGATVSQLSDALFAGSFADAAMERIRDVAGGWIFSGTTLAAGLLVFGVLTLTSAWILYRNVIKIPRSDRRHAPA